MKHSLPSMLIVVMFGWLPPSSYACYCMTPDLPLAVERAEAVFVGEVFEIVPPLRSDSKAPHVDRLYTIKFLVEKSFKGPASVVTKILSSCGGGCLSFQFVRGEKYLVYAESYVDDRTILTLGSCGNRTVPLSKAIDDVTELEEMSAFDYSFGRFSGATRLTGLRLKSADVWWRIQR